jgi:hypothetical protein
MKITLFVKYNNCEDFRILGKFNGYNGAMNRVSRHTKGVNKDRQYYIGESTPMGWRFKIVNF